MTVPASCARLYCVPLVLALLAAAASFASEPAMTATQLLANFSGKEVSRFEPLFQYSDDRRIVAVEIHAVGMEITIARYSGQEDSWYEVNNILRVTTADGYEGVSGVDTYYQEEFSDTHLNELKDVMQVVVAMRSLDPAVVSSALDRSHPDLADEVRSSVDIALWDLAARRAGLPLHKLFGAQRKAMEAYASLPFYEALPEYIDAVNEYAADGYTAFKFHVWGSIEEDLQLVRLVQQTFAESGYRFMVDLESMYDFNDAVRLAEQMDEGQFLWFEAPIDDSLLEQYGELRKRLGVLLIPAGYSIYSAEFIRQGIDAGAWDAGRFDATVVGGISKALELLVIANAADLTIDIQSWGHSLAQAANLHVMLANDRTQLFEAPMPAEAFEFGMVNGKLVREGTAVAPSGPGLGIDVDWERLPDADFYAHTIVDLAVTR